MYVAVARLSQRVINKEGRTALAFERGYGVQKELLLKNGVEWDSAESIHLEGVHVLRSKKFKPGFRDHTESRAWQK